MRMRRLTPVIDWSLDAYVKWESDNLVKQSKFLDQSKPSRPEGKKLPCKHKLIVVCKTTDSLCTKRHFVHKVGEHERSQ